MAKQAKGQGKSVTSTDTSQKQINKSSAKNDKPVKPEGQEQDEDESYDEDEDEDYDPSAKPDVKGAESEGSDSEAEGNTHDGGVVPDFSKIENTGGERLVQTRRQRLEAEPTSRVREGLVQPIRPSVDIDDLFANLKEQSRKGEVVELVIKDDDVCASAGTGRDRLSTQDSGSAPKNGSKGANSANATGSGGSNITGGPETIIIETSYTFAGKVITERKPVEVGSAEAKAYLNSTGNIVAEQGNKGAANGRSFVPIVREVDGEFLNLRIKLKRPSLIDKFLSQGNKHQKLSTLEKSRLDWASFVDKRKIQDDLKLHNKDGYLDKQDFLNRVELKKDEQYKRAQEEDRRIRMNNEQQKQG